MVEVSDQIIDLLVAHSGVERNRFQTDTRLLQDIGMDGDDASEFFEAFGNEFGVDLANLWERWDQHFRPEPMSVPPGVLLVYMAVAGGLGFLVHEIFAPIPFWLPGLLLAPFVLWLYSFLAFGRGDDKDPITVQNLINSAAAGKWVKVYEGQPVKTFRLLD